VLLAGCTFSVGVNTAPTVPAHEIETSAAEELEKRTGMRPTIECGDQGIPVEVDTSVTCVLVDPVAGLEFDTVISFTEVVGRDYAVAVEFASVANNAPVPTAAPGATVPLDEIQALAIGALTPGLGFVPEVRCEGGAVEVVVGSTVSCSHPSPEGVVDVVVTISAYDATTSRYAIRVS